MGGQEATPNEWPWQAQIRTAQGDGNGPAFCGASLISSKFVMSAAHCFQDQNSNPATIEVRVGDHDRSTTSDDGVSQFRKVVSVNNHPNYDPVSSRFDFAIIELETPFVMSTAVSPVCLPGPGETLSGGETCWITGWGTLSSNGYAPNKLQEAEVEAQTNDECDSNYGGNTITDDMLCAQGLIDGDVTDACQGDSGGPLVCEEGNGRWVLHGATSWGHGCADAQYPGVWARISHEMTWIQCVMSGDEGC